MVRRSFGALAAIVAVSMLTVARPALTGRVTWLIYSFDIGSAPSLPWSPDYNLANLVSDTEALLTPSTPVIVRFETLRRAVLYASSDRRAAEQLLRRFTERALGPEQMAARDGLGLLDTAFVIDALWQIGGHYNPPFDTLSRNVNGLVRSPDGYALVRKGLVWHPDDPEYEFGAAMIAGVNFLEGQAFNTHARKAIAGSAGNELLARNLNRIYADQYGSTASSPESRAPSHRFQYT